jgi:hypothetical protein
VNVSDLHDFVEEDLDFGIEHNAISVLHHGRSQHAPSCAQTLRARIRMKRSRRAPHRWAAGVPSLGMDAGGQFMDCNGLAEMATDSDILAIFLLLMP